MSYRIIFTLYDKNAYIILEKPSIFCKKVFTIIALYYFFNDSFSLNFPISRENSNLEPITIRSDVGHPVYIWTYFQSLDFHNLESL